LAGDFRKPVSSEEAGLARPAQPVTATVVGLKEHYGRCLRIIGDVFDGQHATIAVADHDRVRKTAIG
jgi:hypothetical protein